MNDKFNFSNLEVFKIFDPIFIGFKELYKEIIVLCIVFYDEFVNIFLWEENSFTPSFFVSVLLWSKKCDS
jgi:hypothetical protein